MSLSLLPPERHFSTISASGSSSSIHSSSLDSGSRRAPSSSRFAISHSKGSRISISCSSSPRSSLTFNSLGVISELARSEEHTSELQSRGHLVCRLLLEKKKRTNKKVHTRNA